MNAENNTLKAVKDSFQKGYEMLPAKYLKKVRLRIMNECGWTTRATFVNKQKGHTSIRKPEIAIIEKIFSEYNLDPWTGKPLK